MLGDIESFLAYPWGRESFLATLPRFLPPPVSKFIKDPGQAMRVRLSQQTTACYGFPLALQLFAFQGLRQLLCKIPDGARTVTFLGDPTASKDIVTILSVEDILAVEADAALSVHLDLIPERERHMWLEEVEDDRVTRFVEMMRSGKTLKPEDFPGGDRSFAPKIEGKKPVDVSLRTKNLVLEPSTAGIYVHGMRTPNAAEDCLQPENSGTVVTALTVYSNVLLVRPQSYVSPPKSTLTRRYRDEEHVPVAWEERNPNIYNSVKTVHASHPASSTYPESEPKVGFLSLATGNHWRYLPCNYHIFRPPPSENKVSSPLREVAQGHRPPQQGK
ncbi:unnamed protein product [Brassica oleracea]